MLTKGCNRCHEEKDLDAFFRDCHAKDGRKTICRDCELARVRAWREKNQDQRAAYERNFGLKRRYGITLDDFAQMLAKQSGLCAICGADHKEVVRGGLLVDHDHSTGEIRELLCDNCNKLLGHARDDSWILERAIAYLAKHTRPKAVA